MAKATPKATGGITGKGFVKGDPRINRTKPGTGRPPDEFKRLMREMASRDTTLAGLDAILKDPENPHYLKAWEMCADRGYEKPTQGQTVSGVITINVKRK